MALIVLAQDFTSQISQILPSKSGTGGLYLGNIQAIQNPQIYQKFNIKSVLSILSQKQIKIPSKITHLHIKIPDSPFINIIQYFNTCFEFIQKGLRRGNVFVHCVAGISRSASIVIGYLLKYKDYNLKQAIKKVKKCRTVVNPNKGFLMQLEEYEKKIIKKNCKK